MRYSFSYIKGKPKIVTTVLNDKGHERYVEFLVDSGADYTILSKATAGFLDIDYKTIRSSEIHLEAADMRTIKGKKVHLVIKIGGKNILTPVFIANQVVENLLGRRGIFDHYEITFKEKSKQVVFKEI